MTIDSNNDNSMSQEISDSLSPVGEPVQVEATALPMTRESVEEFLGPFDPPQDFDHGEEFAAIIPRPIPKFLRTGSHGQRSRGMVYSLIALGIMCVVFSPIPFVRGLSFYILPLKWLHWIGFGLVGIGVWKFLAGIVSSGRFAYVQRGEPFVGRVVLSQRAVTGTQEAPTFCHVARVEFLQPLTNEYNLLDFPELDQWPLAKQSQYMCNLQPGEYVTLVHFPEKPNSAPCVYGFLGLNPEREYILRNGQPIRGTSPFTAVMIAFLIAFILLLCMAAFDVMLFSFPISGDWKLPVAIAVGGFIIGGVLGVWSWTTSQSPEKSKGPSAALLGFGFLGAVSSPLGFFILNSRLDFALSQLQPVEILEFWETTHNFVIRDYELEYKPLPAGAPTKKHLRFSQVARLYGAEYGAAEIGPGRFGYPWLKGVHPIQWIPATETDSAGPVYEFKFRESAELPEMEAGQKSLFSPVILLDKEQVAPLPEGLLELELQALRRRAEIEEIVKVRE